MELGDPAGLGYEEEGGGIQADFQINGLFIPLGLRAAWQQPEAPSLCHQLLSKTMEPETLINRPEATYRSSSLVTICLQDILL